MPVLLVIVIYSVLAFVLLPPVEATTTSIVAAASLLAVLYLTRSKSIAQALQWFKQFKLRGIFVILLSFSALALTEFYLEVSVGQLLIQGILVFLWFWVFAAIETYFRRRSE